MYSICSRSKSNFSLENLFFKIYFLYSLYEINAAVMVVDDFINYLRYERNYSECTIVAYRKDLLQFIAYLKELDATIRFPEDADADLIRRWEVALMDKISPVSVNRKLSSLKSFLNTL